MSVSEWQHVYMCMCVRAFALRKGCHGPTHVAVKPVGSRPDADAIFPRQSDVLKMPGIMMDPLFG